MSADKLQSIFLECQDSQNQHLWIKAFCKIYESIHFDQFWTQFLRLIKHALVIYSREPAVEKTIEFIAKAVAALTTKDTKGFRSFCKENAEKEGVGENEENDDDDMHPLLLKLFEFLLQVHSAKEKAVRFRVCQLISQLLNNLGEGAKIDDSLYDSIYQCMVERVRDKCPLVRVHAILALTRLQDPTDETCPITKVYIILLTRDPTAEVRRIILTCLAPSTSSLPAILERTHDVKETVRRTAFTVIAEKIPLRALSVDQRIQLLHDGFGDRSETVKAACSKLLQAWLTASEGDMLELLDRLDVVCSLQVCQTVLSALFKNSQVLDLVQKFYFIKEGAIVSDDNLTCEGAFYWHHLVQYLQDMGPDYQEQLEQVCPNCVEFCSYMTRLASEMKDCEDVDRKLDIEFILEQLIHILCYMDYADQASRKSTKKLLHSFLTSDSMGTNLVPHIIGCLKKVLPETEELIGFITEIISDIREPISTMETSQSKTHEEQIHLDKHIAGIRVKLHQLREELGDSIDKQDFERAAQLKVYISNLDAERHSLLADSQPKLEEVRIQKNDAETIIKCLTIVCELLTVIRVQAFTPVLQTLLESQILPAMVSEDTRVREAAVRAIGLCCLIKKDIVMEHLPLLLQATQMDTALVRAAAMKSIFDIIHVFGLEAFTDEGSLSVVSGSSAAGLKTSSGDVSSFQQDTSQAESVLGRVADGQKNWSDMASKVISILSASLDSQSSELRCIAAEGLAKLLLCGRVVSPKLLSHLLILWYNPLVEEDETLLQYLGVFFPMYAFSCSANQQQFEEAFIPTLQTIIGAPPTSPLAEINDVDVAYFLMELTNAQNLVYNQKSGVQSVENPCHDGLALKICNDILSYPDTMETKLWLRMLNHLNLTADNLSLYKSLITLCENMATVITDKQGLKLLEKFQGSIMAKLDQIRPEVSKQSVTPQNDMDFTAPEVVPSTSPLQPAQQDIIQTMGLRLPKTPAAAAITAMGDNNLMKSTRITIAHSHSEDLTFATPVSVRSQKLTGGKEKTGDFNFLPQTTARTTAQIVKTPKRPLHSIQDPKFTK